ncbi:MAG: DoxX family protein [Phycisphaeraceae bacterium]|nr:DoxX family protein [Phycisphaeraceae bacterium]
MCSTKNCPCLLNFALFVNRLALGLFLLLAGVSKLQGGVEKFVQGDYAQMTPAWLPTWFATPYGYFVPFGEVIFGAMLILGLAGRLAAIVVFLMLTSFTIATYVAGAPVQGPFSPNLILIALAFLLAVIGPGGWSLCGLTCRGSCGCLSWCCGAKSSCCSDDKPAGQA